MTATHLMQTYDARLASFGESHKVSKKEGKGSKTIKWPHKTLEPTQLARSGLFYQPSATSPDNATCFLCQCHIDAWEKEDDPVTEHLTLSPSCPWAMIVSLEREIENGNRNIENPLGDGPAGARLQTFESRWPHEGKRGWLCKSKKMAAAGWYYCSASEGDDLAKCPYCNLSLDGWEPKDDPHEEHQRRSPDCIFFSNAVTVKLPKNSRVKGKRQSKASRMSNQSVMSMASEGVSMAASDVDEHTALSTKAEENAPKTGKSSKTGAKNKKTKAKPKTKALTPSNEVDLASSFNEAEDDDFEVKVDVPKPSTKSRKRKSSHLIADNAAGGPPEIYESEIECMVPPKRRRTTTEKSSVVEMSGEVDPNASEEVIMTDVTAEKPAKPQRGVRKPSASARTRKSSLKKAASKATFDIAIPKDEEIEAALQADLERPLTDDGEGESDAKSTKRRTTRSKVGTSTKLASGKERSVVEYATTLDSSVEEFKHDEAAVVEPEAGTPVLAVPKPRKQTTRKASAKTASSKETSVAQNDATIPSLTTQKSASEQAKNRKASKRKMNQDQSAFDATAAETFHETEKTLQVQEMYLSKMADIVTNKSTTNQVTFPKGQTLATANQGKSDREADPASMSEMTFHTANLAEETVIGPRDGISEDCDHDAVEYDSPDDKSSEHPGLRGEQIGEKQTNGVVFGEMPTFEDFAASDIGPSSPPLASGHSTPAKMPSPQSSDAENQPPSARPSQMRPPLSMLSPSRGNEVRLPLANITPTASPSRANISKLRSILPWSSVDVDNIFHDFHRPGDENTYTGNPATKACALNSPEKTMTVEDFIRHNAVRAEDKLRNDCERLVGKFEAEGMRALRTLEGIVCSV